MEDWMPTVDNEKYQIIVTAWGAGRDTTKIHDASGRIVHYEPTPDSEYVELVFELTDGATRVSRKVCLRRGDDPHVLISTIADLAAKLQYEPAAVSVIKKQDYVPRKDYEELQVFSKKQQDTIDQLSELTKER